MVNIKYKLQVHKDILESRKLEKPLSDIRVVDMTHVWFGPWATQLMAQLGAEVIRVEPPWGAIDRLSTSMLFGDVPYTYHHLNLNKKDIAINLKDPEGLEIIKDLIKVSDIVIQNMSYGAMEKLGLGYEQLKEIKPDIIYAALSGFGQTGPYKMRKSYASIAEAMSGHTRLTGDGVDPEGKPIQMAQAYGDIGPGTMAAFGIMAALRYRDKTGKGQMIDVAQFDVMTSFNTAITGYSLSGLKPHEIRAKFPGRGIGGIFKTSDGKWVQLGIYNPKAIDAVRQLMGRDEVTKEEIQEWIECTPLDEVVNKLGEARIPIAPVYHIDETFNDPHLKEREMFVEVEHALHGKYMAINFPFKMSLTPGEVRSAAPLLGQNNHEIIVGILGRSEEEFKELQKKGVISFS